MTARELLEDALAKAEACIAPTSACGLHIARAMERSDETEARKVLERALQELRDIQLTPHDRAGIEREAYCLQVLLRQS